MVNEVNQKMQTCRALILLEGGGLDGETNGGGVFIGALAGLAAGLAGTLEGFGDVTRGGEACRGD